MTSRDADIVADILGRCEAAVRERLCHAGMDDALVSSVCNAIREQDAPVRERWHGERHYVPLRPRHSSDVKRQALADVNIHGKVAAAAEKNGMSKPTLYRLLTRKLKK